MPRPTKPQFSLPRELAGRMLAELSSAHLAVAFVDTYARQFDRPEASAHPERRRELEAILDREILLAMSARVVNNFEEGTSRRRTRIRGNRRPEDDPALFLRDLLAMLAKESRWTAGDAMEFRGDLEIYRRLTATHAGRSRPGSTRTAPGGPFVDRCAILLDPSMIENASRAAGKFLLQIEGLADKLFTDIVKLRK